MIWPFKPKKVATLKKDIHKVGSRLIRIDSLNMVGPFIESQNRNYLLLRADSDKDGSVGGYRESGNGRFALINNNNLVFVAECERPTMGDVSNNGVIIIGDTLFGDNLNSKLLLYSAEGVNIFSHLFTANIWNVGISIEGDYASIQLCNSDSNDANKLYIYDVKNLKFMASFVPDSGWADKYEFSDSQNIISLCYKNDRKYKYSFDGTFLDKEKYKRERIQDASSNQLVLIVREELTNSSNEQLKELLPLINTALDGELSSDYDSLAYRLKGEILDSLGEIKGAIEAYRSAINIDPKIGVKRRLTKLEKELQK